MPNPEALDQIGPNTALATAASLYPVLFRLITPHDASAAHFMKNREIMSVSHCILMVSGTLVELYRQRDHWTPPAWRGIRRPGLDIIDASPPFANALISFECGYLLQDFVVLLYGARRLATDGRARSIMARNVNWRVLGWHHLGLAVALGIWHVRVLRHTEKGSLVVMMMILMNASYVSILTITITLSSSIYNS